MSFLFSQSGLLSLITLLAIFAGMGWFAYKMYKLSGLPRVEIKALEDHTHTHQH